MFADSCLLLWWFFYCWCRQELWWNNKREKSKVHHIPTPICIIYKKTHICQYKVNFFVMYVDCVNIFIMYSVLFFWKYILCICSVWISKQCKYIMYLRIVYNWLHWYKTGCVSLSILSLWKPIHLLTFLKYLFILKEVVD